MLYWLVQAEGGFQKAGGFKGVYNGVVATALGAAPGAAMFFSAYEGMKPRLQAMNGACPSQRGASTSQCPSPPPRPPASAPCDPLRRVPDAGGKEHPLHHSFAASCGEVAACLVRVPTAVVTQNMQVGILLLTTRRLLHGYATVTRPS